MHRQRLSAATLTGLISLSVGCAGLVVAHGASGGNSGAGHRSGFHGSTGGHGHQHRGGAWQANRSVGAYQGRRPGGLSVPGLGYFFASLPSYCTLVYWEGVPYYYADDVYYEWNGNVGAYEEVLPPSGLVDRVDARASADTELFVFPNGDQTNEQLERDRDACRRWAVQQVGFDPETAASGPRPAPKTSGRSAAKRADYLRADRACLEARDYSVE